MASFSESDHIMQTTQGTSGRQPVLAGAGAHPRWLSPAVAAATFELRDLAPRLASLLYVTAIPDNTVRAVLEWSEDVISPDSGQAFALDRLRAVLPALTVAYVVAHTYSRSDAGEGVDQCIDLHDQGCGALVRAVRSRINVIAMALHGEEGRRLVAASHAGLADHLERITRLIMTR